MQSGIRVTEKRDGATLEVEVTGKLRHEDFVDFVPQVERCIHRHGKLRILFAMIDFHGWDGPAFWDEIKFDVKHFSHFERIAVVGDRAWEKNIALLCRPFTTAKLRYFERPAIEEARNWLAEE
jgi:hypothetical protein